MRLPRRGWALIALVVVVFSGFLVLFDGLWLPGAYAGALGVGVALVAGVWVTRGSADVQASLDRLRMLRAGVWRRPDMGLPRVADLDDAVAMGVHPAAGLGIVARDRCPAFIVRGFDEVLRQALRRDRFVLLVGESTAGKSRAAYELVRSELMNCRVVHPARRDTAQAAAELAAGMARSVLWLDDLERFLGTGGLTGPAVHAVLNAPGGNRFIVATMRSEEHAKYSGRTLLAGIEGLARDTVREGWDVLRLATRIEVPRLWSDDEVARARSRRDDPRLVEAARHAAEYGIAEYLAAAPQLLSEWRDAWAPGSHPRAAAMVLAAVDARRSGVHRPLPASVLLPLHEPYLRRRGGDRLRPESIEDALSWATTPLYATSSLLMPDSGGFVAFDYLIDSVDKDRVPAAALEVLVAEATPPRGARHRQAGVGLVADRAS